MRPIDDPTPLTPDQRREEVASILAAGVLRLHARAALSSESENIWPTVNLPLCGRVRGARRRLYPGYHGVFASRNIASSDVEATNPAGDSTCVSGQREYFY